VALSLITFAGSPAAQPSRITRRLTRAKMQMSMPPPPPQMAMPPGAMPPMAMPPMAMPPMAMPPMAMPPMHMSGMAMSFNDKYRGVTLLFASWMPESTTGFVLSCLAIMAAAAFDMVLKKLLSRIERRLMRSSWPVIQKNACRAVITLFQTTLSYSLMLLAMTFDVYVFFSIIVGFSLGVLISGHWNDTGMPSGMTRGSEIRLDELRLAVSGMTCEGCKSAVTRALNSVDGVESVDVDLHSGISTVISTGVPIAALVAAVEATGKGCCVQSEARSFKRVTEEGLQAPFLNTSPECCR